MYSAMVKRQAAEAIEAQKVQIVAALYSNPNWDDEEADRPAVLEKLESQFDAAVKRIYDPKPVQKEAEIDWDNPFWQAALRAQERIYQAHPELRDKKNVGQAIPEMSKEQLRARQKSREEIDQL